jgi:hypothetical protein
MVSFGKSTRGIYEKVLILYRWIDYERDSGARARSVSDYQQSERSTFLQVKLSNLNLHLAWELVEERRVQKRGGHPYQDQASIILLKL